jgi:hypothetical protein
MVGLSLAAESVGYTAFDTACRGALRNGTVDTRTLTLRFVGHTLRTHVHESKVVCYSSRTGERQP